MGSLELLKDTSLSDRQQDLVDTIISSNSVLLILIEDILQLVKIEHENRHQGSTKVPDQTFCLDECLQSLNNIVVGYATQFCVHLKFKIDERIKGMIVKSNRSRVHQILSNLLTNAVKASNSDGNVELDCQVIEEGNEKGEAFKTVQFKVRDFGCGIPQSKLQAIFEPFVQLHNVNESKVPR